MTLKPKRQKTMLCMKCEGATTHIEEKRKDNTSKWKCLTCKNKRSKNW